MEFSAVLLVLVTGLVTSGLSLATTLILESKRATRELAASKRVRGQAGGLALRVAILEFIDALLVSRAHFYKSDEDGYRPSHNEHQTTAVLRTAGTVRLLCPDLAPDVEEMMRQSTPMGSAEDQLKLGKRDEWATHRRAFEQKVHHFVV